MMICIDSVHFIINLSVRLPTLLQHKHSKRYLSLMHVCTHCPSVWAETDPNSYYPANKLKSHC